MVMRGDGSVRCVLVAVLLVKEAMFSTCDVQVTILPRGGTLDGSSSPVSVQATLGAVQAPPTFSDPPQSTPNVQGAAAELTFGASLAGPRPEVGSDEPLTEFPTYHGGPPLQGVVVHLGFYGRGVVDWPSSRRQLVETFMAGLSNSAYMAAGQYTQDMNNTFTVGSIFDLSSYYVAYGDELDITELVELGWSMKSSDVSPTSPGYGSAIHIIITGPTVTTPYTCEEACSLIGFVNRTMLPHEPFYKILVTGDKTSLCPGKCFVRDQPTPNGDSGVDALAADIAQALFSLTVGGTLGYASSAGDPGAWFETDQCYSTFGHTRQLRGGEVNAGAWYNVNFGTFGKWLLERIPVRIGELWFCRLSAQDSAESMPENALEVGGIEMYLSGRVHLNSAAAAGVAMASLVTFTLAVCGGLTRRHRRRDALLVLPPHCEAVESIPVAAAELSDGTFS